MKTRIALKIVATVGALATLAACVETSGETTAQMPVMPGGPTFTEGSFAASDAATKSCRDALVARTDGSSVRVVGSRQTEGGNAVSMRVGDNGAPWLCFVGADGSNPSVEFQGSDSFQ